MEGVVLRDGRLLEVGGYPDYTDYSYAYNPRNNRMDQTQASAIARFNPATVLLPNGNVFVVGGFNNQVAAWASFSIFNSTSNTWTNPATPVLSLARSRLTAAILPVSGRVLVIGGLNAAQIPSGVVEISNPTNVSAAAATIKSFTVVAPLRQPRAALAAFALNEQFVLVVGGRNTVESLDFAYSLVEIYDVDLNVWRTRKPMLYPRWGAALVKLPNGLIAAVGGCDGASTDVPMEYYNHTTDTWTLGPTMIVRGGTEGS